jgi:hypothetical protein
MLEGKLRAFLGRRLPDVVGGRRMIHAANVDVEKTESQKPSFGLKNLSAASKSFSRFTRNDIFCRTAQLDAKMIVA